ncbi:hypothetical protein [Marinobacterium sp. xm-a-152]|uniref:type IV pilus modification PilV family protein n=1 Tax=Marinobacterium sp. xm-a-152 TaxID=2497733 RepID=UPI001569634B|nr:hypothetical protein [Marinobacterium sp. xm-a-152]NRP15271.1 hypothetical protein [Marinobacterium sp. xm-a-152]
MLHQKKGSGFVLIEALIALVVSAVGLLGVAFFTTTLFSESTDTKARFEALLLAQAKIDKLRELSGQAELASLGTSSWSWPSEVACEIVNGSSETFSINGTLTPDTTTDSVMGVVNVYWGGSECDSENNINLSTVVVADAFDISLVGGTVTGVDLSGLGTNINPPTGNASYGDDAPGGVLPVGVTLKNVVVSQAEGSNEIRLISTINGEEKELLVTTDSAGFAEVRGIVYVLDEIDVSPDDSNFVIKPSDTGVCPKGPIQNGVNGLFIEYVCFFGGGWYGNIPIFIGSDTSQSVVGDPTCDTSDASYNPILCNVTNLDSRSPEWADNNQRIYRGYSVAFGDGGALFDNDGNLILISKGLEPGDIYGYGSDKPDRVAGHNFVLAESTTTPLQATSSAINNSEYTSLFSGVVGAAFNNFLGNKGDYVCLDIEGSKNCPNQIVSIGVATVSASKISISGSVSGAVAAASSIGLSASNAILSSTDQFPSGYITACYVQEDGSCDDSQSGTYQVCTTTGEQYDCDIYTSGSWTGQIQHVLNDQLTDSGYQICSPTNGLEEFVGVSSDMGGQSVFVSDDCSSLDGFCTVEITSPSSTVTKNKEFTLEYTITNAAENATSVSSANSSIQNISNISETKATVLAPKDSSVSFKLTVTNTSGGISCSDSITLSTTNN